MAEKLYQRQGRHAVIEQFLADGIETIFGNPGTVEQGFLDALDEYPEMKYILTLQESVAVFAGDGFARSRKTPAVIQIHSSPGLGNSIGAMYQAYRGHSPLIVIGGDAGLKYLPMQAQMYADLVSMAKPVTKLSEMVHHPESLLRTLRRAIKVAMTPPMGPVYICLPADVLDMPNNELVFPSSIPAVNSVADKASIASIANVLMLSREPRIFIGDGIHYSNGGSKAVTRLAEIVGADIYGVDAGEANVELSHRLYRGQTGHMFGESSFPITSSPDAIFIAGTYMVPEVFPRLGDIYGSNSTVMHVDLDGDAIARNHRVDIPILADPTQTFNEVSDFIENNSTVEMRKRFQSRKSLIVTEIQKDREISNKTFRGQALSATPTMAAFASQLFAKAKHPILVEEALTNSPALVHYYAASGGTELVQTRGGSLGMGLASAIGVQSANPGRLVISASGDGGAMYTIQSLWTAARHKLPIKYVVCSNGVYDLLRLNIVQYWTKQLGIESGAYPTSFDISSPELLFDKMAEALSVPSVRVEKTSQIAAAIDEALKIDGPFLIDLRLNDTHNHAEIGVKCGQ